MATLRQIATAFDSPVARSRVRVAMLMVCETVRNEAEPDGKKATEEELVLYMARQNLVKIMTRSSASWAETILPRVMANAALQNKVLQLTSVDLDVVTEAQLDNDLISVVSSIWSEFVDMPNY